MEGLSCLGVSWECTRVFLRLVSLRYDSRGGDGKIACVVGSARRMLKFFWMILAIRMLRGWYVRTKGTRSVLLAVAGLRAWSREMALTFVSAELVMYSE